ncbi:FecCD family ABC transporter permease [Holophaga foetida]|uniref:FecCD family ABC transporter permease n=1 Tax=Holophaga foetida TaxID=35839 RepID=UPI0002473EF6|nr:iron ABC transporter permease [Holophaga foetida]
MRIPSAFLLVALLLLACVGFALTTGQYHISLETLWKVLAAKFAGCAPNEDLATPAMVLWSVRLPRVLMAILAGAALSVGGVVFQGIMKNPLVSPSFLGVTHGAVFGASLAIIFLGKSAISIESSAFFWAVAAVAIVYAIGGRGINTLTTLVIAGVIVSTFFMAASSFLKYIADPNEQLPAIVFWTMGGLNNVLWTQVIRAMAIIVIGIGVILTFRGKLNLLALGDEEALSMGVNVKVMRILFMLFATLIVAAGSSSCGIIMWVDLIVAHIARLIVGPDHGKLVPFSALLGALFLLSTDTVVRLLPGGEIPISIVTSFIGAPLLGYLLMKQNNAWKA